MTCRCREGNGGNAETIASPDLPLRTASRPRQDLGLSGKHCEVPVSVLEECCWQETKWLMVLRAPVGL